MAEFDILPIFTDAYLADTRHFTAAQHGAYFLLMMTAWRTKENGLPDDDDKLAKWASMDKRTWLKNRSIVLEKWCMIDGLLHQKRLDDERKRAEHVRDRQVQGGLASALKRKNINSRHLPSEHPRVRQPPSPSPSPSTYKEEKENIKEKEERKNVRTKKTGYPEGFLPDIEAIKRAGKLGLDVEREAGEFRDWTTAGGYRYADWQAAFRNHLNRAAKKRDELEGRERAKRQDARDVTGAALRAAASLREKGWS